MNTIKRRGPPNARRCLVFAALLGVCPAAHANPTTPVVVNGTASFSHAGNVLNVTNSPNAIINWGSFSIAAGELTRFIQPSSSSAVLNRVTGPDPSSILGALQSNGRVFLLNPNGIVFGTSAQINVAGLVASTLALSDADFLAGRMRFTEVANAGTVVNQGAITAASGGQVYLVGSGVTNGGVITAPSGEVILAAGNSVELVDPGTPNLRVEIVASDNEARNLEQIAAASGRVGIYAGLIRDGGSINADRAVSGSDGRIMLKAGGDVALGDVNFSAVGGTITLQAGGNISLSGTLATELLTIDTGIGVSGPVINPAVEVSVSGSLGLNPGTITLVSSLLGPAATLDALNVFSNIRRNEPVQRVPGSMLTLQGLLLPSGNFLSPAHIPFFTPRPALLTEPGSNRGIEP